MTLPARPHARPHAHPHERGAALLAVLLLVAVMAVLAALMLDRLTLATRLAGNAQAQSQARLALGDGEQLALAAVAEWQAAARARGGVVAALPGPGAAVASGRTQAVARIEDADNCFNVNALAEPGAEGTLATRLVALGQLRALMASLGIAATTAIPLSDAMADWVDADDLPAPNGAEDDWYLRQPVPYRSAGQPIADLSELRAVRGMTAPLYERLRPWLCARPETALSVLDINTLRPDQARLLAMLAPAAMPLARAQALLQARPAQGWPDTGAVLRAFGSGLGAVTQEPGAAEAAALLPAQLDVRSRWLRLVQTVTVESASVGAATLIDLGEGARNAPPRIVARVWGADGA